jgi:hypothetical protein
MPNYWKPLTPGQEAEWKGNADLLARHWSGLGADAVRLCLCNQEDTPSGKAYADDHSEYADCWQLCDFLRKLGTPYPEPSDE